MMKNKSGLMTIITSGNTVLGMLANAVKIKKKRNKKHK